ncbi:MAG: diguanylate cyclase [Sulfurimonas sp.]|jgi:diguanylate cyclase (GGDEF)-like protein/PAS domain S-box-containing protein
MLKDYSLLYVEDNAETMRAFIGAFEEYFKEVHVAKDGEEGLSLFEKNSPDIVLTDIQMPKIGGLDMIARMRESSPNIPIIVNSAFSDTHLLLKAIALHVDDYILKPTNPVLLLGTLKKIAHILTLEKKLDDSHKMMQTIIDEIPDPILYILPDYTVSMMNKAAKELKGEGTNEVLPQCYKISNETSGACTNDHKNCPIDHISNTKQPSTLRHIHTDKQGKKHHIDIHAKPIFDNDGDIIAYLEIRHDISAYLDIQNQLLNETKKLTHISMHDSLTHLPNRRLLADRISHTIEKKNRSKEMFALFFIDLDHFKEINDSLGHLVGDQLLVQVAKRIQKAIRKGDTIARNGGDEFVLIVDNGDSDQHFISVAEKILELFKTPFLINHKEVFSSCSIGISIYPNNGETAEVLLKNSDAAMYDSKKAGRHQFAFYSSNL